MPRLRTHPGEVLAEEYLKPLSLSASALAQAIGVPANRITDIIRRRRDVSADTAIRLGRFFAVDPRFWLNLQTAYDLSLAESAHDYSSVRPRAERPTRGDRHSKAEA
jgi:addiction module HigA family antidote